MGRADRTARKVEKAARVAKEELTQLSKKVEALARDLKKASERLMSTLPRPSEILINCPKPLC